MDLFVDNIRSFVGPHTIPLAPLTILVGENSSGKTTFLAAYRLAWDAMTRLEPIDFNDPPFTLGAFNDIASITQQGQATCFRVGFRVSAQTADQRKLAPTGPDAIDATVFFISSDGQPVMNEWKVAWGPYSVQYLTPSGDQPAGRRVAIVTPTTTFAFDSNQVPWLSSMANTGQLWQFLKLHIQGRIPAQFFGDPTGALPKEPEVEAIERMMSRIDQSLRLGHGRPYASAPIRTRPRRTYDPVGDKPTPEGDHVPMLLNRLHASRKRDPRLDRLLKALSGFGVASGMFSALSVKRMGGEEPHYPFQIRVDPYPGFDFNLVDVGYGVSQVLPILVDAVHNPQRVLLLQQPEVHLHPRAQAELGSFLGGIAVERRDRPVLVETHSDYLLDRLRMDIRDQKSSLRSSDVAILHFERVSGVTKVDHISIDENGNLVNVPSGYRSFFLEEERRLLNG